jgi:hypothetical protein
VAPNAIVSAGVEATNLGDSIALGFAPAERESMAVWLDPASLSATATVRTRSADPVRRVTPFLNAKGARAVAVDVEKAGDRVRGRRTFATNPPLQIGETDGHLVWIRPREKPAGALWELEGGDPVDAIRAAQDPARDPEAPRTSALTFRRGSSVWMGAVVGTPAAPAALGDLAHFSGLGEAVGAPAIAIHDGVVLAVWADRATSEEPWRLRWVRFVAGTPAEPPQSLSLPEDGPGEGAMSPALVALGDGRFLLVWTDGPTSAHAVRAITLSSEARPLGPPIRLSDEGTNAGQAQAATNAQGQGVVAFLQSRGASFEVAATPIACSR